MRLPKDFGAQFQGRFAVALEGTALSASAERIENQVGEEQITVLAQREVEGEKKREREGMCACV
jgi:hypothetical protein